MKVCTVGRSSSQQGSLSVHESMTSPDLTTQSSQSSIGSDADDFTNAAVDSRSIQEVFTELIEAYDQSTPSSEQQRRAMNRLWCYYGSHADELEACAPELEALLCSKHVSALEQSTPFMRVSTSPSQLSQQQCGNTKYVEFDYTARWDFLPRRSRSMS